MEEVKPFDIPKREVWEAFKKVKANQGAAGVDGQSTRECLCQRRAGLMSKRCSVHSGCYIIRIIQ